MKQISHSPIEQVVQKISATSDQLFDAVVRLISGDLMVLEITDFLTPALCGQLVETLSNYTMDMAYLGGNAGKILQSQHDKQDDPEGYFAGAENHLLLQESCMVLAIGKIMELLAKSGKNAGVAFDPTRKKSYCPAIIREFHSTLKLHNDYAKREAKGWNPLQNIDKQWAFVLKLTSCTGGETRWFPCQWTEDDQVFFNKEDNYSYSERVVNGYPEVMFKGAIGTLILFDCTCYHAVDPVIEGRRYTLGGFVGTLKEDNDQLIVWS